VWFWAFCIFLFGDTGVTHGLHYENKKFYETRGYYCDSTVLDVFSFELLKRNKETALSAPNSIIISEDLEKKYFGSENSIGKILELNNRENLTVTGVFKNIPDNSHFVFDMLLSFRYKYEEEKNLMSQWMDYSYYTYIKLSERTDPAELDKKLSEFISRHSQPYFEAAGGIKIRP
jgi:putative ABC transport system permease protein